MRKQLQVWAESLETFALEVIFGERHDFKANVTRVLLSTLSRLFHIGVDIRRRLYNNFL